MISLCRTLRTLSMQTFFSWTSEVCLSFCSSSLTVSAARMLVSVMCFITSSVKKITNKLRGLDGRAIFFYYINLLQLKSSAHKKAKCSNLKLKIKIKLSKHEFLGLVVKSVIQNVNRQQFHFSSELLKIGFNILY